MFLSILKIVAKLVKKGHITKKKRLIISENNKNNVILHAYFKNEQLSERT